MASKSTRIFLLIAALILAGTRYMNRNQNRINFNNEVGIWNSKGKDGLRQTIVTRSNDTAGEYFVAHLHCSSKAEGFYPSKPCSPPMHTHETQVEEFEVISGVMMVDLNGTQVQIPVGEKRAVPMGLPHMYWNGGQEPLEVYVRVTPGVPAEHFLEMVGALSHQFGGLNNVNPMQLVLLFVEYDITLTDVPKPLWLAAKKFLVPLARILGLSSLYPEYVSKAGQPLPVITPAKEQPFAEVAAQVAVEVPAVSATLDGTAEAAETTDAVEAEEGASDKTEL